MNLDIFREKDLSGALRKEAHVSNKYPEQYTYILDWCLLNNLSDLSFKLKVYHVINDLKFIPKCTCTKEVNFKNSDYGYNEYCSKNCVNESNSVVLKRKETNLKLYGTEIPQNLELFKKKSKQTNQLKYGVDYPWQNQEIKKKYINTMIERYGVDNPNKSKEILIRRIESFKNNIDKYKETYKKTNQLKYGVDHPWQNKDIHKKCINKILNTKYVNITNKIGTECIKQGHLLLNIDWNIKEISCLCNKQHTYEITNYLFHKRILDNINTCTICNKINTYSGEELNLRNFIIDNYNGTIIYNNRKILNGKELDIYLPDLNLAFEFNGLYWHSEANKYKNYHLEKTNNCADKNIKLIHIWEDDWLLKQDIVKSIIKNALNKTDNIIFGRKCEIRIVDNKIAKLFLIKNHLQGNINAKYNIGLYYLDELVSLMTFGNLRKNLGQNTININDYEMYRFCNKLNTTVIGGASKLFKYFNNNYTINTIISYADYSRYTGNIYKQLGFVYDKLTIPNYYWIIDNKRSNRYNWRKDKLVKLGYDKNLTEVQIMHNLKSLRIYDCGNLKYIFKNSNVMGNK
jgi:hypothetical protein